MIIDCIADLHGHYPKLEGGDLLIVAGDLTARDTDKEHLDFIEWIAYGQKYENKYKKIIYIAGNHDNFLYEKTRYGQIKTPSEWNIEYLCDSGTEFTYYPHLEPGIEKEYERRTFKIWGSPWTKTFSGMNPKAKAFTVDTEEELFEKWKLIPEDTDILVTHSPPYGILDRTTSGEHIGSKSLQMELFTRLRPKLFVCGHIHEAYGIEPKGGIVDNAVNASHVNEHYEPVNKPIRVIW